MRQKNSLRESEFQVGAHLLEALQRRRPRLRDVAGIARRGEVAEAQPRVIVAGADDAVEIDLAQAHRVTMWMVSPISTSSSSAASRSIWTP